MTGVICLSAMLVGCNSLTVNSEDGSHAPGPFEAIQNLDLQPRYPERTGSTNLSGRTPHGVSFFGHDVEPQKVENAQPGATKSADGEGYQLNFEDAPVTTVAKVIIGDILRAGYTVDPRIQGTITLSSGRPIPRNDLLFVLEGALRASNAVLVPDGTEYRIIPASDAAGAGTVSASAHTEPGYGITVIPIHYTSAQTLLKLLDSFALKSGSARVDQGHNMIVVQGSGLERRAALQTILNFDVDWMRGQSVGIYPLQSATPKALITDLQKVMRNGDGELNQGLVEFQPVDRLNAVLVVSKRSQLLRTAATWIKRLDRSDNAAIGVRVYRLQYASAKQVAKTLNNIFSKSGESGLESAKNEIAPGAGVVSSSSSSNQQQSS